MRCLIIGGDGMLGHRLLLAWADRHAVRVTLRRSLGEYASLGLFTAANAYDCVDVRDAERVRAVLHDFRPQAVVNAAGIIKHQEAARDPLPCLEVNAVFPHRLRLLCVEVGARLIHVSTDCVFSGRCGGYTEGDRPDAEDLYGLSKYLGEVAEPPALTLRTSIIGLELTRKRGLVEWFLGCRGRVRGYTRAVFSGLTTSELARVIERVLLDHPELHGVRQVAATPISKYELLTRLAARLGRRDVEVCAEAEFVCDRSLSGNAFERDTRYRAPAWDRMLDELAGEIKDRGHVHEAA